MNRWVLAAVWAVAFLGAAVGFYGGVSWEVIVTVYLPVMLGAALVQVFGGRRP